MSDASSDNDEEAGEKIRVSLTLASEVRDRSLEVPTEPIAVPADIGRKGLAAVINHLLDRKVVRDKGTGSDDDSDDGDDGKDKLPAIPFDFVLKENNRLLRSGVEREARRYGMSLEKPLAISYFPAQEAPELQSETEVLPDWISCLSYVEDSSSRSSTTTRAPYLCAATYDGSLRIFQPAGEHHDEKESVVLNPIATATSAHGGPIKCLTTMIDSTTKHHNLLLATGSMDHTLSIHSFDPKSKTLQKRIKCLQGHTSAIGSLDLFPASKSLASGGWDGTLTLWDLNAATTTMTSPEEEQASKKAKTNKKHASSSSKTGDGVLQTLTPKAVLPKAHSSQISGISWGNLHKYNNNGVDSNNNNNSQGLKTLVTGSWDHSVRVWDMERQECVLSLNGSRVVACLDTSYHSEGIVATGHPDCTIRLWDVRTSSDNNNNNNSSSSVSDKTFRPSHKAWVSAVQWSPKNPYHLASTSHDGTVKVWDIRSSVPLHTVRVFPKTEKGLSLVYGQQVDSKTGGTSSASLFLGGTDCVVKHFTTNC